MQIRILTTLRGKDNSGAITHWPDGFIFDDEVEPIPDMIISELELATGTVEEITPNKVGGSVKKASPKPKASSPKTNKPKAKAKAKAKPKTKSKSGAKRKKI